MIDSAWSVNKETTSLSSSLLAKRVQSIHISTIVNRSTDWANRGAITSASTKIIISSMFDSAWSVNKETTSLSSSLLAKRGQSIYISKI